MRSHAEVQCLLPLLRWLIFFLINGMAQVPGGLVQHKDSKPWERDASLELFDTAVGFSNWEFE